MANGKESAPGVTLDVVALANKYFRAGGLSVVSVHIYLPEIEHVGRTEPF